MIRRRLLPGAAALALACSIPALPAAARDFVQDGAGMFSAGAVAQLDQRISNFNAQTGKEVVVVTVPSLGGQTLQAAAQAAFAQQNVNGVLIYIAKDDRRDIIVPDESGARAGWFTPDVLRGIREQMESQFKAENYDAGIAAGVGGVLDVYRQHVSGLRGGAGGVSAPAGSNAAPTSSFGGFHLSMFWWIVIFVVGFLILRSIMRSMAGPRYYGGGPMPPGAPGGPGYGGGFGGPGYYGGGGGGFWSGLLGGLGGAWLGNELFGQHGANVVNPTSGALDSGGGWGQGGADPNAAGWQSDAGQADMGGASGGDWSGGGFGGDSGGGFGGGGDSGGGW